MWNGGRAYGLEVSVNDAHAVHVPQAFGDRHEPSSRSIRRLVVRRGMGQVQDPTGLRLVHSSGTA